MMYLIDLFCGLGGSTLGAFNARDEAGNPIVKVIYCVNHNPDMLRIHTANHPQCVHAQEDIRFANIEPIQRMVERIRVEDPQALIVLHASLDCTQHTRAKGGQRKNAESRTLAWHLDRYIEPLQPDCITIENVQEFMEWGPTDENDQPIKALKGTYFVPWLERIDNFGYHHDYRMLNAATFGAYTSRDRLFITYARPHLAIQWPQPTHMPSVSQDPGRMDLFGRVLPFKAVEEVLNLTDTGISIFERHRYKGKKPLKERTLRRILAGLKRYADQPFLMAYYGNDANVRTLSKPAATLTTKDRLSMVTPVSWPRAQWLDKQYNGAHNHQPLSQPAGTLTTSPKHHLVTCIQWLDKDYNTAYNHQPLSLPAGTLTTNPKFNLISGLSGGAQVTSPYWNPQPDDSPTMRDIREQMRLKGIHDLHYRGLFIPELLRIQGFPEDYQLPGTKSNAKRGIGNSVVPLVQQRLLEAHYRGFCHGPHAGKRSPSKTDKANPVSVF